MHVHVHVNEYCVGLRQWDALDVSPVKVYILIEVFSKFLPQLDRESIIRLQTFMLELSKYYPKYHI